MKYMLGIVVAIAIALGTPHKVFADDVYACQEFDWEIYVSTERIIINSPVQLLIVNGIKFVTDGEIQYLGTATFYLRNNVWWGNILMNNVKLSEDYPISYDETAVAIFNAVRK